MLRMVIGVAICLAGFASRADQEGVEKYRDYLPDQLLSLPEAERSAGVPMMYLGAAQLATSPLGDIVAKANLNMLMYDGLGDYEAAKRAFQSDLGEDPTGELTVWQTHALSYRASRLKLTSVSFFPFDFTGAVYGDQAQVRGTAKIIDEKIAYPINHVWIDCDRTDGLCRYRQIALTLPDETSWTQTYHVGQVANESYRVTRWEDDMIEATPILAEGCRINQLSLNFATQEFYEIARNRTGGDCETTLGVTLPNLDKPRVSQIVEGVDIVMDEFERLDDEAFSYLSSAFRDEIAALAARSREGRAVQSSHHVNSEGAVLGKRNDLGQPLPKYRFKQCKALTEAQRPLRPP